MLKILYHKNLKHLNKAVCIKKLGEGGFGTVQLYQCKQDLCCDKHFVVKTIKDSLNNKEYLLKYFYQEYDIGILLDHPNIRKTLDIDTKTNSIIFENCPGIDLLDFLDSYKYNTKALLPLFSQILDAVEYLHEKGIAHLDLKLENIIVHDNIIKIIDFGGSVIYKINNKTHLKSGLTGTLQYMPPEILQKKLYKPDKVDIWYCGIILYNIIYNHMPWDKAESKTDTNYKLFKNTLLFHNNLHLSVFKPLENYSKNEQQVIMTIFKHVFQINPDHRKPIQMIRSLFKLIQWDKNCEIIYTNNDKFNTTRIQYLTK